MMTQHWNDDDSGWTTKALRLVSTLLLRGTLCLGFLMMILMMTALGFLLAAHPWWSSR